jgi:ACT domain-containing protein
MELSRTAAVKIVRLLEGVRRDEGLSIKEFVGYFEISTMSYYKWRRAVKDNRYPKFEMETIDRGLEALGYDIAVIIPKRLRR